MPELADERRDRVLRAATECFARHGYRRASMDLLARAAEMSRPALYQYFRNKEEVFRAVVEWVLGRTAERAEAAARGPGGPEERLGEVLEVVLALHEGSAATTRFRAELVDEIFERADDLWAGFEERILAVLGSVLDQAAERVDPGVAGMTTADAAVVLLYGAKGIGLRERRPQRERTGHVRRFVAVSLRGMARTPW